MFDRFAILQTQTAIVDELREAGYTLTPSNLSRIEKTLNRFSYWLPTVHMYARQFIGKAENTGRFLSMWTLECERRLEPCESWKI